MNYKQIEKVVKDRELPLIGETGDGDPMIISKGMNGGKCYYKLEVPQDNGWVRHLYYYEDGTSEELFEQ